MIKNKLWLKLVNKQLSKGIVTRREYGKTAFFFDKSRYLPDRAEMEELLCNFCGANYISGWDIDRFGHGDFEVHFNPLIHGRFKRKEIESRIKKRIKDAYRG